MLPFPKKAYLVAAALACGGCVSQGRELANSSKPQAEANSSEPDEKETAGGLKKAEIEATIQANIKQIYDCYNDEIHTYRFLMRVPLPSGKLYLDFNINDLGKLDSLKINEKRSTLGNKNIEACVLKRMAAWEFPKPRGGGTMSVGYPFTFTP